MEVWSLSQGIICIFQTIGLQKFIVAFPYLYKELKVRKELLGGKLWEEIFKIKSNFFLVHLQNFD